jgi:hypothetical protein
MSMEHDQEQLDQTGDDTSADAGGGSGDSAGGGGGDLSDVLGNQEASFVSDEKKSLSTGTVIMAGLLLACGAGTYFMYNRSAPASTAPSADTAAAQKTITQFLSDDKDNVNKMKDLLVNTEKAVEQFRASPGKVQVPVDDLQTNPFRVADVDTTKKTGDEDVDKLTAKKREEAAKAAALKAAQALNLQFVMSGKRKSCMINNAVYREGQAVGEFTVESINTDSVVIRKDEQKFELKIKK